MPQPLSFWRQNGGPVSFPERAPQPEKARKPQPDTAIAGPKPTLNHVIHNSVVAEKTTYSSVLLVASVSRARF